MPHEGNSWTPPWLMAPAPRPGTAVGVVTGSLSREFRPLFEAAVEIREKQVTGSMSREFCPVFGPCRLRPEAPLPASALGLATASAPAPCDACPHAGNQGAAL